MSIKRYMIIATLLLSCAAKAQVDTTDVYKDASDTLSTAVATGIGGGNTLSRFKDIRTEVISAAGLCKMACCNLAESFENSASVTVGYSDAVTGARQIRLLGLSGVYTQMLDENRPVMRGIAAPFGLSYIPGQWLNSIQIAKGAPSVINGVESITGQINMEHRKPTDEIPLFVNASVMSDTKADLNIASSLQLDEQGKWSTAILGHVSGNFTDMDMNNDGFVDDPRQMQFNLANRWLYYDPDGMQVRFGVKMLYDDRKGGQRHIASDNPWLSDVANKCFNAYLKVGVPLNEDNSRNIAFVGDFNDYVMNGTFARSSYNASQLSGFANLLYQNQVYDNHHFTFGLSAMYDHYNELIDRYACWKKDGIVTNLLDAGVFGEYTYHFEDKLSVIAGARADWYNSDKKLRFSPRLTAKYTPVGQLVLRLNAGRGLRYASPLADNLGVLSTGKRYYSEHNPVSMDSMPLFATHPLEDSWIFGGNLTYYLPFGLEDRTYVSFDYFRTQFTNQLITDYNAFANTIDFYMLKGQSYTDTYQLDFFVEPLRRFEITATFRYSNAKVTMIDGGLQERPMTSRFKGVLNLQYATNLNKWIFDFTASVNGPCRLYDFMGGGYSQVYPLLYLQVTHRMRGWDLYIGGENLTNFKQKNPIIDAANPFSRSFDASCIWGPLMGARAYVGVRITLWKKG